jgi:hypothetical protein
MENNDDDWIASIASYVRNSFGNKGSIVTPAEVARVRAAMKARTEPWTLEELRAMLPQAPLANRQQWKLTSSHNPAKAQGCVDGSINTRWDTGKEQSPGMWFQIELPQPTDIAGLLLDSTGSGNDYPRGYRVELSNNGTQWNTPVATGKGTNAVTEIVFKPAKAKFIRITQTGEQKGKFWSIHELDILEPPRNKLAAAKPNGKKSDSFE